MKRIDNIKRLRDMVVAGGKAEKPAEKPAEEKTKKKIGKKEE